MAASGSHLVELINDNKADIITTLVHKFDKASKIQNQLWLKIYLFCRRIP